MPKIYFSKPKNLQMKKLLQKTQIAMRKCKGRKISLTAGQLKQGNLEKLIHHDEETKEHGN